MIQETARITEEIRKAEEEKVRIESYTLDGQKPELYMCPGDLIVLCNVLHDYAELLENIIDVDQGYQAALYQYHAQRCRKIQHYIEKELNYDAAAAIRRCRKKTKKTREKDDIGEDAFVLAVRRRRGAGGETAEDSVEESTES